MISNHFLKIRNPKISKQHIYINNMGIIQTHANALLYIYTHTRARYYHPLSQSPNKEMSKWLKNSVSN